MKNIQRDQEVDRKLKKLGWQVLRVWESDIKKNVRRCGNLVEYTYWRARRNLEDEESDDYDEYD